MNTCLSHIIVNFVNTANVANLARAVMTYAVRLSAIVSPRAARHAPRPRD